MKVDQKSLPDDVAHLKQNIISLSKDLHNTEIERDDWKAKYNLLRDRLYGKSSEKDSAANDGQQLLFNEAEHFSEQDDEVSEETITYTRKKKGRKPIPEGLPAERVEHDLLEEEKICPCCQKQRPRVSEKISKEVDFIAAKVKVIENVYPVYGPCKCDGFRESDQPEMIQPKAIPRMIPGSYAAPGMLAYLVTSKFVDGLPFCRQEKIFSRYGFELSRETMCNWFIRAARKCQDLMELLWEESMTSPLMQMDETTIQVLKEAGRSAETNSYMWVNIGYPQNNPIILFHYHPSRAKEIPLEILKDYKGHLQTDGYPGYDAAGDLPGIILVGCWTHARRYFIKASRISKKAASAREAIALIKKLYIIETKLRQEELDNDEFVRKRREQCEPILEKFHKWLIKKQKNAPPKSLIGEAVNYTLNQWDKLVRYLDAWYLTPDNNRAENAIRPFVIGRKNWLFSDTPRGAHASATFYSLVETAKANGLEPYAYLRYLFTKLPSAISTEEKRALLPHKVTAAEIKLP